MRELLFWLAFTPAAIVLAALGVVLVLFVGGFGVREVWHARAARNRRRWERTPQMYLEGVRDA